MKYYSEITKKVYDTVNDLKAAEESVAEKANVRKKDAEAVEKAFNEYRNAKENYEKVLKGFCDKYGAYHKTIKSDDARDAFDAVGELRDLVNLWF